MSSIFIDNLIQRCSSLSQIKQIQAHLITTGLFQNSSASRANLLELAAIAPFGDLSFAALVFRHIERPLTKDWNAVIRGQAGGPFPRTAVSLFLSMSRAAGRPDALTCSFTLKACARGLSCAETHLIHSQVIRFGFKADLLLVTTLLDAYVKVGEHEYAQKLFDEMPRKDVSSWNALIGGLAQGSRPNEALELFGRMRGLGLQVNDVTVLGALSACSQLGSLSHGEKVWRYVKDEMLDTNTTVCNAVIDMFAKCGFVNKACNVFRNMSCKKSIVTWNTMIMGFGMHGHGEEAIKLFKEMEASGVSADSISFLAVLCACNHAGLVQEGIQLFDSMEAKGVERSIKHYGTMVDLLGRSGRLGEAYEMINSMSTMPDIVLWQTLLGACKTHGNVDMAELASRKLVEMGSNNCGDFVLLSNVYATRERWKDVGRVRETMKIREVKKVPGFSYMEVDGIIHKFITGDKSHPSWTQIYTKLDEIMSRIPSYGYIPGTNFILHDIGEEEKAQALFHHSEKVAVAFALIRTDEGTPIQVIKNLRICGDCHTVIKLVSLVYHREIIVRDRARFHRFKDGTCSCKDYW
ncbi:hypothetical protein Dimus_019735 [Dionaea muscipula]